MIHEHTHPIENECEPMPKEDQRIVGIVAVLPSEAEHVTSLVVYVDQAIHQDNCMLEATVSKSYFSNADEPVLLKTDEYPLNPNNIAHTILNKDHILNKRVPQAVFLAREGPNGIEYQKLPVENAQKLLQEMASSSEPDQYFSPNTDGEQFSFSKDDIQFFLKDTLSAQPAHHTGLPACHEEAVQIACEIDVPLIVQGSCDTIPEQITTEYNMQGGTLHTSEVPFR